MDFDGVAICGQTFQSIGPLAKWPGENPRLPHHLDTSGYRGSLTPAVLLDAYARAWAYWADVVEITPVPAATAAEAWIRAHFAREDGPSGVLAWSYLADNTNSPKAQRYDNSESWVIVNPERPTAGIDLVRVACHEIGHVLGLDHDGGNADALMRPSYSTSIPKPTARDVQRMVGLGYKRRTNPIPPPGPPPTDPPPLDGQVIVNIAGKYVSIPTGWTVRA